MAPRRIAIKAIEICFPRSARQRCLTKRMRNLAAKVPQDQWPEVKARVQACYRAPSRAIARDSDQPARLRLFYRDTRPHGLPVPPEVEPAMIGVRP